jgi:DNA-binding NtrC family response regulator
MRLLIVGTLNGQLTTATKLAMDRGATVTHASDITQAMAVLRSGRGADLMVDVAVAIRDLVTALEAEHIHAPIVACGTATDARAAVAAIQTGAKGTSAAAGPGIDRRGAGRRRRRHAN